MKKVPFWKESWFWLVILGFAFMISMFQIDSYAADKFKLNWMWWTIGGATGLGALYFLIKVVRKWG